MALTLAGILAKGPVSKLEVTQAQKELEGKPAAAAAERDARVAADAKKLEKEMHQLRERA